MANVIDARAATILTASDLSGSRHVRKRGRDSSSGINRYAVVSASEYILMSMSSVDSQKGLPWILYNVV